MENTEYDVRLHRMQRKIDRKNKIIDGLKRVIGELEHKLAKATKQDKEIERAVQRALSNVRLIPVVPSLSKSHDVYISSVNEKDRS